MLDTAIGEHAGHLVDLHNIDFAWEPGEMLVWLRDE